MVSSIFKGFFLFIFVLPDVLLCYETGRANFLIDSEGNRRNMGLLPGGKRLPEKKFAVGFKDPLPESFDTRTKWPECINITGYIRQQGACLSSWAFAVAEIISDRICIKSNGTTQVLISPEDLMTCCQGCNGCDGDPGRALDYWINEGIVTGGDFNSSEGCRPYSVPHDQNDDQTHTCNKTCQKGYPLKYDADKYYGSHGYSIPADEKLIQQEIIDNGPVTAAIIVYRAFVEYQCGVLKHFTGNHDVASHVVKILGWGVEHGTPYWLCANSWGTEWGDKGYFKILRGNKKKNCNIEQYIHAGTPRLQN